MLGGFLAVPFEAETKLCNNLIGENCKPRDLCLAGAGIAGHCQVAADSDSIVP